MLEDVLREQQVNLRGFWGKLRSDPRPLPASLCRVQVWDGYLRRLSDCGSALVPSLHQASYPLQPHPDAARLDEPITEDEVLEGLLKLHKDRATSAQGYPAELLKAAQPVALPGEIREPHVLAPLLTRVFNAAFQAGHLPSHINRSYKRLASGSVEDRVLGDYKARPARPAGGGTTETVKHYPLYPQGTGQASNHRVHVLM
jgi:hypothetical protein